jgi:uncharacterized protein YegP (UPF0339 family)
MDWIGLYQPGAANTAYLSWKYDSSCTTAKASGSCSMYVPTTAGTYQFRLLANDGFTAIATSGNVTVIPKVTTNVSNVSKGGSVTVSWSGVSSPAVKDWLGLYVPGAANTAYLNWKYDSSCTQTAGATAKASGSCSFTMPNTAGTYQFRLLANDGFTAMATSPNLTVS